MDNATEDRNDKALADRRKYAEQLGNILGIPKPPQGYSNMNVTPQDIQSLMNMIETKKAGKKDDETASSAGTVDAVDEDEVGVDEWATYAADVTKTLKKQGWSDQMIPTMVKSMWAQHKATVVKAPELPTDKSVKTSPKVKGKRKREDDYADCKSPDKWPADLLKSIMDAAGLKKGKKDEMVEALRGLIIYHTVE